LSVDDAFSEQRIESGLKQHPNWSGTVYGICETQGCGNRGKIGYYQGGFCKLCSHRHREDQKLPVLNSDRNDVTIPNPNIRWSYKCYVKDMSDTLSANEKARFYETPEKKAARLDRVEAIDDE